MILAKCHAQARKISIFLYKCVVRPTEMFFLVSSDLYTRNPRDMGYLTFRVNIDTPGMIQWVR